MGSLARFLYGYSGPLAGFLYCFPLSASAQGDCSFFTALTQSRNAFTELRGEPLPSGGWRAKSVPSGFPSCQLIEDRGDGILSCTTDFIEADHPATLVQPVGRDIKDCLGNRWKTIQLKGTGIDVTTFLILNDSPLQMEITLEREPAGINSAIGLASDRWKWRAAFKAIQLADKPELPTLEWSKDPRAFCAGVKTLLKEASTSFAKLKGDHYRKGTFKAHSDLIGFHGCTVNEIPDIKWYACSIPLKSRGAVAIVQRLLIDQSMQCLGPDWKERRRAKGDGLSNYELSNSDDGPSINTRGSHTTDDTYRVVFDVTK